MSEYFSKNEELLEETGINNAKLTSEVYEGIPRGGVLVEEPLDTRLWPNVHLSEGAIQALVEGIHEIQRKEIS